MELVIKKSEKDPKLFLLNPFCFNYDNMIKFLNLCLDMGMYGLAYYVFIKYYSKNLYIVNNNMKKKILDKQNVFMINWFYDSIKCHLH